MEKITFIEAFELAKEHNKVKTFCSLVRNYNIIPNLSARGTVETYGMNFYDFVKSEIAQKMWEQSEQEIKNIIIEAIQTTINNNNKQPTNNNINKMNFETKDKKINALFQIDLSDMVNEAINRMADDIKAGINAMVESKVNEALKNVVPHQININISGKTTTTTTINEKLHSKFNECVTDLCLHKMLMLVGPTGSGKTHLAMQLAKALNVKFASISCTAGMSEGHLLGRMLANGEYVQSTFVDCFENGGLFLFDEVDAADANTLLIINSALSNGFISVPNRREKPYAIKNENFFCVCAANTFGKGSYTYTGREVLDEAFLDRFRMSMVFVEYDKELENEMCENKQLLNILHEIRQHLPDKPISTRTIIKADLLMRQVKDIKTVINKLTIDYDDADKSKVNEILNKNL